MGSPRLRKQALHPQTERQSCLFQNTLTALSVPESTGIYLLASLASIWSDAAAPFQRKFPPPRPPWICWCPYLPSKTRAGRRGLRDLPVTWLSATGAW